MSIEPCFLEAQKRIPFTLAGRQGQVAVCYGPNHDAVKAGFDAIPGIPFPIAFCEGYPAMQVQIESYAGGGYRTICGWIQIVTREELASADQEWADARRSCSVDVASAMSETGLPFAVFGMLPSFFDAPCRNLGNSMALKWTADTFLTTMPFRSRDEEITWLLGFHWGYYEYATDLEKPVAVLPLEVTGPEVWNSHLPFLRQEFAAWKFREL
ncbi:MAG: hypothetical protein JXR84_14020 [Anaerolineae bacterium]|nr:hypothetical protein [Anaerolineae bacterium]